MDLGLEIVSFSSKETGSISEAKELVKKKTMYLSFNSTHERDIIYGKLLQLVDKNECATAEKDVYFYTNKWCAGEMSNFDYLMIINSYA